MKKILLPMILAVLLIVPYATAQDKSMASGMFDFPGTITIGDTLNFSAYINFIIPDTGIFSEPITINLSAFNGTDTINLCDGSLEFIPPSTIAYSAHCEIPDDFQLGEYHLIITISTAMGEFVLGADQPLMVLGTHDINGDATFDVGDIVYLVDFQFHGGEAPLPGMSNADCNCDGIVDVEDLIGMVDYQFHSRDLPCFAN